jgi:predicted transposase/invertase (TIGR01784 family)
MYVWLPKTRVMPNNFDRIVKENFRELGIALLNKLMRLGIVKTSTLPTKMQFTIPEAEADGLYSATTDKKENFVLHIEWQTQNDKAMPQRMLFYNAFAHKLYVQQVKSYVLYIGKERMTMANTVSYGKLSFEYDIIDLHSMEPSLFLDSDVSAEVIFAILTVKGKEDKRKIVRKILAKLHLLLGDNLLELGQRIVQLELLASLRDAQQIVIEEEQNMPLVYDIKKDIRYQQGEEKVKVKEEAAINKIKKGFDLPVIHDILAISFEKLNELKIQMNPK